MQTAIVYNDPCDMTETRKAVAINQWPSGFVTLATFFVPKCYKGGQVTKLIILVKIC